MKRHCEITFTAQGEVEQTLEILDSKLSGEDIVRMLSSGKAHTTLEEGRKVVMTKGHDVKVIARVIQTNTSFEFDVFDLEADYYWKKVGGRYRAIDVEEV